ncbi:MAG: AmmeMemoRadiSam system radical SAM enzyme [Planctomycetota bacterium]|jgi:pyruvate formate lyase activating enzyme
MERRGFLARVGQWGAGACLACASERAWASVPQGGWQREIDFYDQLPGKRIQCHVCPLDCLLNDGETCFCRTRTNVGGRLYTRAFENPCILRIDAIEKMPLNHFNPGTKTLTIGVGGCNVRCVYCQNWEQSQNKPDDLKTFALTARDAVEAARKKGIDTIAFNYTEPIAFLEYAKDVAVAAKQAEMKVVVASAAFVEPEPLLDFARYVDAFVISLKGFSEEFYKRALGIRLEPVLRAIATLKSRTDCWLELINLVVPTYNDDLGEIRRMCGWIRREVGPLTPLHFARFVPMYKLANLPRTPVQTLERACEIARQVGLKYVYTSNIAPHDGSNTYCHKCRSSAIQRLGFKVLANELAQGQCPKCHYRLPGVWA